MILTGANLAGCRISVAGGLKKAEKKQALTAFLDRLSEQQRGQIVLDDEHRKLLESTEENTASASRCFIATAACGSADAGEVVLLRRFRDRVLRSSRVGRVSVRAYEAVSPAAANRIAQSRALRQLARILVVRPASRLAAIALRLF
jgi:hypothetical protein